MSDINSNIHQLIICCYTKDQSSTHKFITSFRVRAVNIQSFVKVPTTLLNYIKSNNSFSKSSIGEWHQTYGFLQLLKYNRNNQVQKNPIQQQLWIMAPCLRVKSSELLCSAEQSLDLLSTVILTKTDSFAA